MGTVANAQGFNNHPAPATNRLGETTGAVLAMSAGWGDRAMYFQEVTLDPGRYVLKIDIFNANTPTTAIANFIGFIPNVGDPIYSTRLSFPTNVWITDSVSFFLTARTTGRINLGLTTASGGSATGPRVFLDNAQLLFYGVDKSGLKQLIDVATELKNNPQPVGTSTAYTDLNDAITIAQITHDKPGATAVEVVSMESLLREAIANVHGAILLHQRVLAWTTLPFNATDVIVNPSFEDPLSVGWTNQGVFQRQTNDSFNPFRAGSAYAERWISSGSALTNLRLSQTIKHIPNGVYLLTVSAHAMQQTGGTFPGGAFIVANDNFVEVFERKDYSLTVVVEGNELVLAFEVAETGNWVAVDNFRLTYISDGSPYIVSDPKEVSFSPSVNSRTINLSGGNLNTNVTVTAPPSFNLSQTSFTPAELTGWGGANLTITYTGSVAVAKDSLVFAMGESKHVVYVSVRETLSASNGGFLLDQSLIPIRNFTVTADVFSSITLTAPRGILLDVTSITPAEAINGRGVVLEWDYASLIEDKFIYINSGSVKDSIQIFATPNNLIANWDGDDVEGENSRLIDFGWNLTEADGVTPVTATFNPYNATSGIRLVPITTQNYTYLGKPWSGHRVAYLRTWGDPATNVFNLPVELTEGKTYRFRGVAAWHDNGTNPTFKFAVNSMRANLGDTLGIASAAHTVRRSGHNFNFTFTAKTTGTHFVTVSSTVTGDVILAPFFLSIHETRDLTSTEMRSENKVRVFPTVARGFVHIDTGGETGMVRIFDLAGRLTGSKALSGDLEIITLPAEGVYILQIKAGNQFKNVKVINGK